MAVRVVVEDARNRASFRAPLTWTPALAAGYCGRPRTEEYRQRLDADRRCFAAALSLALMEPPFRRDPRNEIAGAPSVAEMGAPEDDAVVHVKLAWQAITASGAAQARLAVRGEAEIRQENTATGCRETCILPPDWTLRAASGTA